MKLFSVRAIACAVVACSLGATGVRAATVNLSLNVFPTSLAAPNAGGMWRMVATTDAPLGISGISAFLQGVNVAGLTVETDINSLIFSPPATPYVSTFAGFVNSVYGQNTAEAPIVVGVGRPIMGDGQDPFGDPAWNNATWIFKGTYNGLVPIFGTQGNVATGAAVLLSATAPAPSQIANVTTVVRVATPEPSTLLIAVTPLLAFAARMRTRMR